MRKNHLLSFTIFFILFFGKANIILAADFDIWFESGTTKIRQDVIPKDQSSWGIQSAKNEFEPFQLVLKRNITNTTNIDVEISDFIGTNGTIAKTNVTIFKEHYLNITNLSTIEGETGEWPDALLPKKDAYYKENRSTFPFNLNVGRVQPIWFDLFVPANTAAGQYSAIVTVTENSTVVFTGTVNLTVWNFALPATSSFPSYFNNSPDMPWKGFYGADWVNTNIMKDLQRDFIKAGLRHRISTSPYYFNWGVWDPVSKSYSYFDHEKYDYTLAGYIDGSATGIEYGEARLTGLSDDFSGLYLKYVSGGGETGEPHITYCHGGINTPPQAYIDEVTGRATTLVNELTETQKEMTYYLLLDEPGGGEVGCGSENPNLDYNSVKIAADILHSLGLKTRQTSSRKEELLNSNIVPPRNDYIDRWVPYFGSVVGRDWEGVFFDKTADYAEDINNGAQLWWYHSCMTGGCNITGGSGYNGNPHYTIEYSAMHSRIFPWMSYKYNIQGETYWSVSGGFGVGAGYLGDPYYSLWSSNYDKNGDGNFFYPGVVDTVAAGLPAGDGRGAHTPSIGGTHNIPIESIRLKMLREGREDYEYLKMLKDLGNKNFADEKMSNLVTNTYTFVSDENILYENRALLGEKIEEIINAADSIPPNEPSGLSVL